MPVPIPTLVDAKRRASDLAFERAESIKGTVTMEHYDGSTFTFHPAFVERLGEWVVIVTEHHGEMVYHQDELVYLGDDSGVLLDNDSEGKSNEA